MSPAAATAPPRPGSPLPGLSIDAHLDLEVGGVVHELRGSGRVLRLTSPDPALLLSSLPAVGRGDLADLADGLDELGVTVELARPDGRVTGRLGADAAGGLGRVVTGSDNVEIDALRLVGPALRARGATLDPRARRATVALVTAAAAAVLGWLVAR